MASQTGNDNAVTFSLGSSSENAELNGNRVQHSTRTISGEWIVEWLAPSSDVGDITFSISGLATGGNNGNAGDDVYTGAIEVSNATGTVVLTKPFQVTTVVSSYAPPTVPRVNKIRQQRAAETDKKEDKVNEDDIVSLFDGKDML